MVRIGCRAHGIDPEDIDTFSWLFYRDIESWFSAGIACCDVCYEDFVQEWPAVYQRDLDFQRSAISVTDFYSGSRLPEVYTKKQFDALVKQISCPNCGGSLTGYIWPYNLPSPVSLDVERAIYQIGEVAKRTPYLVLDNLAAKEIRLEINKLASMLVAKPLECSYFRGRTFSSINQKPQNSTEFLPPHRRIVQEGRYNHAGQPRLYLGCNPSTCYEELRQPKERLWVAEFNIDRPLMVLDLMEMLEVDNGWLAGMVWSTLVSSPEEGDGWYKPQYAFTRFIADCAYSAGFDAIRYPSVRLGVGSNLVLLNEVSEMDCERWVARFWKYN